MDKHYRFRVKGSSTARRLSKMADSVNDVWNFCIDTQKHALRWKKRWPSGYDYNALTAGCSKQLGVNSDTIQIVGQRYAQRRDQARKPLLRYRTKRSLGWVPFKASAIKMVGERFRYNGNLYSVWYSRKVPGKIKCGSFSQDSRGRWYINVCVDIAVGAYCGSMDVGVDLGLTTVATLSNGEKYEGAKAYSFIEKKLAIAQRAHKKSRARSLHAKAKNKRHDAHQKFSTNLVKQNCLIVIGNIKSMKLAKTHMGKSVYDAAWFSLRHMLRYKSIASGATYIEVDEYQSSQMCSACGTLPASRPLGIAHLRIREWVCSNCGQGHDRDVNAARNILAFGSKRPAEGIQPRHGRRLQVRVNSSQGRAAPIDGDAAVAKELLFRTKP